MRRDAIILQLINIGEQANHLSRELRDERANIPWRKIIGFRNIAVHEYPHLDLDKVWKSATVDVPRVKAQLEDLFESAG